MRQPGESEPMATDKKFIVKNGLVAADLSYPTTDGTSNQTMVTDGAGNLSFASTGISETVQMLVKNVSGGSLAKGTPIHQTGTAGQHSEVIAARADTSGAMPAVGVLAETLADEAEGYAVITGRLSNIDTSSYSEGDVLFVGATGGLTSTKPTGESNVTQNIGIVNKVHASSGSIIIYGSGRGAATPNLNNGNIFIGDSANQSVTSTLDTSIVPENSNLYYTTNRFDTRLATKDTGDLSEGSNLYYTTARADSDARNAVSATDAGGDGSFTYNTSSGTFTYTGPSATEVRAHFSGGTGIDISSGVVSTTDSEIVHDNLSGFVSNEHINHTSVSISAGSGLTGGGNIAATRTINIGEGTGITVDSDSISTNDAEIVHDNLSGFVSNEHINHTSVTLTAGNGLTGGGNIASSRTFAVGEGTGILVAADTISTNDAEIVHDNLSGFVSNEHINHTSVTFTAGDGLTGGGNIASSRTFAVGAGTGVTVDSDSISIGQDVSTSATPTFGNITTTGYIRGPSTFTIDPAAHGDNTGKVVIAGDLQVDGTTTTINSTTVAIDDLNFSIATDAADSAAANGAGITIEGGSGDDATFSYNTSGPKFELKLGSSHEDLQVDQLIAASLDISGNVDVDGTLETDALSINGTPVT